MVEARLPCPVCLGVRMKKERPDGRRDLQLDLCPRCGGMWFEPGEVQLLRAGSRFSVPEPLKTLGVGQCHFCSSPLDREAEDCEACGQPNRLTCPACDGVMQRRPHGNLVLDVCPSCRGVWFDRHEIAAVWTLALTTAVSSAQATVAPDGSNPAFGSFDLLEVLAYSPDLAVAAVEGSANAVGGVAEILSYAPELAGVIADAAGAVFEALIHVIAAILEGL